MREGARARVRESASTARERKLIKILCLSKAKLVRRMMPRPAATRNLNTFIAAPHLYTCITVDSLWNSFKNPKTVQPHLRQTWSPPGNRNIVMLMPGTLCSHSSPCTHLCFYLSILKEFLFKLIFKSRLYLIFKQPRQMVPSDLSPDSL